MNKRKRKKWLKQHNLYVNPRDTWNLDYTIAEFVLPRLKLFKKLENGYPGKGEMDTPEKWNEALDKMILAFEYMVDEDWWMDDPKYDYFMNNHEDNAKEANFEECKQRQLVIKDGLQLFTKWFQSLWL